MLSLIRTPICYRVNPCDIPQVVLTTRNVFIANLALSDLMLCMFTMPLSMVDIITNFWVFGMDMVRYKRSSIIHIVCHQ